MVWWLTDGNRAWQGAPRVAAAQGGQLEADHRSPCLPERERARCVRAYQRDTQHE